MQTQFTNSKNETVKRRLQKSGIVFPGDPGYPQPRTESQPIAEKIVSDAAPAPKTERKFCVQIELNGGWMLSDEQDSDRARDLESAAKRLAMRNQGRKVRVIARNGNRAVLRFRAKDGVLGSY
jgi:hypothetical protein